MRRLEVEAMPSCLDDLHGLLTDLWADAPDVGEIDRTRLTIALAELLANIVEHGRTPAGGPPHFVLTVAAEPSRLVADLADDGVGFPPGGRLPEDELAESGRGLALVHGTLDEAAYERRDDRNHWHLVLHRSG